MCQARQRPPPGSALRRSGKNSCYIISRIRSHNLMPFLCAAGPPPADNRAAQPPAAHLADRSIMTQMSSLADNRQPIVSKKWARDQLSPLPTSLLPSVSGIQPCASRYCSAMPAHSAGGATSVRPLSNRMACCWQAIQLSVFIASVTWPDTKAVKPSCCTASISA